MKKNIHPLIFFLPHLSTGKSTHMTTNDLKVDLATMEVLMKSKISFAELHIMRMRSSERFRAIAFSLTGNCFGTEVKVLETLKSDYMAMELKIKNAIKAFLRSGNYEIAA